MLHTATAQMLFFLQMYIQKLHHFCNTSFPDDGRKHLGNKQLWKIHQSITAEYYKMNTETWKDQQENM